jgi:tripartite-type tricarboxylate transporter receptor subunit TctC
MPKTKILLLAAALLALGSSVVPCAAQPAPQAPSSWPQRSVRLILPLGPGSGADIGARLIAEKLAVTWGQPVVVENRPGGDGFVAINAFVSAHDDHILLFGPASSFTAHPYLHDKLPYDPRDLSPVARVSATVITINVPPQLPVKTLGDLMDMARAQPGKLNWATITGATDLVLAAYLKTAGIDMAKIPYRDTVQAINDASENRLQLYWAAFAIVRGAIQAGRLRALAVTASEPAALAPGLPTVGQAGFPQLTFDGLVGIYGTRDLPNEVRERIATDVKAALADPSIASRLEATGQVVVPGSAAEFAASIDKQRATVAEHARVLGIKAAQ